MPNNFIIPCGTSQIIDDDKLEIIGVNALTTETVDDCKNPLRERDDVYLSREEVTDAIRDVVGNLGKFHAGRHTKVPAIFSEEWYKLNPFGAELSTLIRLENAMEIQEKNRIWNPEEDRIVLIASETRAGLLSRRVIKQYLQAHFHTPEPVEETVGELTEFQNYPLTAMKNLVKAVISNLQDNMQNRILITGGFKAAIPSLTIISLMYGLELAYLFEKSTQVERMRFIELASQGQNKQWRDFWIDLAKKDWIPNGSYGINYIVEEWQGNHERGIASPIFGD